DSAKVIKKVFSENPTALHVIPGFTNNIQKRIKEYILVPGVKLVAFSERPDIMGNLIEKFARKIYFYFKYTAIRKKYAPFVKAFLPLGQLGIRTFKNYGWDEKIMFPFMYNPVIHKDFANAEKPKNRVIR